MGGEGGKQEGWGGLILGHQVMTGLRNQCFHGQQGAPELVEQELIGFSWGGFMQPG